MPASTKPRKKTAAKPAKTSAVDTQLAKLAEAAEAGDLDSFDLAYDKLADLAERDPNFDASLFEDLDLMRLDMLGLEADHAAIEAALWSGDLQRAEALEAALYGDLEDDEDPDAQSPLPPDPYADLASGHPGAVDALLASGADLNAHHGPDPRPALFAALEAPNRSADTAARLIAAGARVHEMTDPDGETVLGWALLSPDMAGFDPDEEQHLFQLLLQHGADPDEYCADFGSVLNRAIITGLQAHVQALLQAGAGTTAETPYDFTIEHLAQVPALVLAAPRPALVTLLLTAGANPVTPSSLGVTPLDFVTSAAAEARERALEDADPWTLAHATGLTQSAQLLQDWADRHPTRRN